MAVFPVTCIDNGTVYIPQTGGTYSIDVKGVCQGALFWVANANSLTGVSFNKETNPTSFTVEPNTGRPMNGFITVSVYGSETDICNSFPITSCTTPIVVAGSSSLVIELNGGTNFLPTGGGVSFSVTTVSNGELSSGITYCDDWIVVSNNTITVLDNETNSNRSCQVTITARTEATDAYASEEETKSYIFTQTSRSVPSYQIAVNQTNFDANGGNALITITSNTDADLVVDVNLDISGSMSARVNNTTWQINIPQITDLSDTGRTGTISVNVSSPKTDNFFSGETHYECEITQIGFTPDTGDTGTSDFNIYLALKDENGPVTDGISSSLTSGVYFVEVTGINPSPSSQIDGVFTVYGDGLTINGNLTTTVNNISVGTKVYLDITENPNFDIRSFRIELISTMDGLTKMNQVSFYQDPHCDIITTIELSPSAMSVNSGYSSSDHSLVVDCGPSDPWEMTTDSLFVHFLDGSNNITNRVTGIGTTTVQLVIYSNDDEYPRSATIYVRTTYTNQHYINSADNSIIEQERGIPSSYTINFYTRFAYSDGSQTQMSTMPPELSFQWIPERTETPTSSSHFQCVFEPSDNLNYNRNMFENTIFQTLDTATTTGKFVLTNDYYASRDLGNGNQKTDIYMFITKHSGPGIESYSSCSLFDYYNKDTNDLYVIPMNHLSEEWTSSDSKYVAITFSDYEISRFDYLYTFNLQIDPSTQEFIAYFICSNNGVNDVTINNATLRVSASTSHTVTSNMWTEYIMNTPEAHIPFEFNTLTVNAKSQVTMHTAPDFDDYLGFTIWDVANYLELDYFSDLTYIKFELKDANDVDVTKYVLFNNGTPIIVDNI